MSSKTIAVFDFAPIEHSPAGSCVLQIIQSLHQDYRFVVFADQFENLAPDQITWVRVPLPKLVVLRYVFFRYLAPLYYHQYLRQHPSPDLVMSTDGEFLNCDICYSHFCSKAYLQKNAIKASFFRKLSRLITHHFNASTQEKAFFNAETIVVPSSGLARELSTIYGAQVEKKIVQISNPVNVDHFSRPSTFDRQAFRSSLGFSDNDIIFVFAALGDFARKGLDLILDALATLEICPFKLLVVGGSVAEINDYKLVCKRLNLSQHILFNGFQSDIRPFFWVADAFVLPSSYEVFPLVALQAAASGLPIVATKLYGVEEFLQDGVNGWLIERNVESLVEVFNEISCDHERLAQMGIKAYEAVSSYNQAAFTEHWRSLFQSFLDSSKPNL